MTPETTKTQFAKESEYLNMLKMMSKFRVPLVTIYKGNEKRIISFGKGNTIEYIFEDDELFDIKISYTSFYAWLNRTFIHEEPDDSIITIYNR